MVAGPMGNGVAREGKGGCCPPAPPGYATAKSAYPPTDI